MDSHASLDIHIDMFCNGYVHFTEIHFLKVVQRWNLKNLSRGLNPPKPGLNLAPA